MAIIFDNPVTAGTVLVRQAIQSPDYSAGVSGWTVNIDGSAEFNNLTIRGTFFGTNYIFNSSGAFFYSGTPAAGNLIASIAAVGGNDSFGNAYVNGFAVYYMDGRTAASMAPSNSLANAGTITSYSDDPTPAAASLFNGTLVVAGTPVVNSFQSMMQVLFNTSEVDFQFFDAASNDSNMVLKPTANGYIAWKGGTFASWRNPAYNTNWLTSTTFNGSTGNQALRYKNDAEDNFVIEGAFKANTVAPGASVFTTIAEFHPKANYWISGWRNRGGTVIPMGFQYTTAGVLNVVTTMGGGAPAINDEYWIPHQSVSLGNI